MRLRALALSLAGALGCGAGGPATAHAQTTWLVCSMTPPCQFTSVNTAVNAPQVQSGDRVEVEADQTYTEQVSVVKKLDIFGDPSGPRPVVTFAGSGATTFTVASGGNGSTVRHLDIRATGTSSPTALGFDDTAIATDLALSSPAGCARLSAASSQLGPGVTATETAPGDGDCVLAGEHPVTLTGLTVDDMASTSGGVVLGTGSTLTDSTIDAVGVALAISGGTARRTTLNGAVVGVQASESDTRSVVSDSVVTSTGAGHRAVFARPSDTSSFSTVLALRNVSAVASGSNSIGLEAGAFTGTPGFGQSGAIDARNVIARGDAQDVKADPPLNPCPGGSQCLPGLATLGYSNFRTSTGPVDTGTIGHNQSADPLFVNPVVGPSQDFHIGSGCSPVIAAGTPDAGNGPSDRDGLTHPNPPSIGAYEFVGSNCAPGVGGGFGGGPGPVLPHKATISSLGETNSTFVVGSSSTPLTGRTAVRRPKRGTTFSFRLDQAATVTIAIQTNARGRRVGRTCKPDARRLRKRPRCTRTITIAWLNRTAHAGANKLAFTGRIRGKALKPGHYQAAFTALDAAGASPSKLLRFTIVKR